MTQETDQNLKRLKKAFDSQKVVRPSEEARENAMERAMQAFEDANPQRHSETSAQKNAIPLQGNGNANRLNGQGNPKPNPWRQLMNFELPRFSHMLAGGASLAAIALAVNVTVLNNNTPELFGDGDTVVAENTMPKPAPLETKTAPETEKRKALSQVEELTAQPAPQALGRSVNGQNQGASSDALTDFSAVRQKSIATSKPSRITGQPIIADDTVRPGFNAQGNDKFSDITPNPIKQTKSEPVSTFSIDVDTASYAFMRSSLNNGVLPQKDAVRVEELINYFNYAYQAPATADEAFRANVVVTPTPWNEETKLLKIGIKGYELPKANAPDANLVFLIDTSGSMNAPNKLPLLRNAFKLLLASLKPTDTVSIVTYAGSAGTALEPTRVADKNRILSALDNLRSAGSTAGAEGIRQAYELAESTKTETGINRVILATDGDFNVGIDDPQELKSFIERKRDSGTTLSVLGFGRGNYNDELMQTLAQNGNGNAAYIDTLSEARKVLVEEAGSTLFTIAKDVKLQVEFNPGLVSEYRLIGYETRQLKREDFNNDKVDAGDIGAGHTVTALYEFRPASAKNQSVDPLRYNAETRQQDKPAQQIEPKPEFNSEYAFLKIRHKAPDANESQLVTRPITTQDEVATLAASNDDTRFAASVAAFGQLLRGGTHTGGFTYDDVISLAQSGKGADPFGYRAEFINLVRLAKTASAMESQKR